MNHLFKPQKKQSKPRISFTNSTFTAQLQGSGHPGLHAMTGVPHVSKLGVTTERGIFSLKDTRFENSGKDGRNIDSGRYSNYGAPIARTVAAQV